MGWLSSFLSSFDSSQRARKGQALSSTHDAFSLPTSSPGLGSHPDAFNPDALHTPDIDPTSPAYTYPPQQSKGQYGYIPSPLTPSRQGSASILPTHMDSLHTPHLPNNLYPPLAHTWNRLRVWLNREYPELGDTLNYGILPQDLSEIELNLGITLPPAVRESYLCVDGQEPESAAGCSEGLFFGLTLLPMENVLEEWRFWREVDEDTNTGANPRLLELMQSIPPRWIRLDYSNRGWIPLIADKAGNYVGVDMNPGQEGSVGQVIIFGRDFDTKVVLWNGDGLGGWGKWLAAFADELESGEGFEIGAGDNSEGSEDGIGYESYYHDGSGHGAGDGGGDSGTAGGLRLIGDYRGWSVLEAWGDRSLRKWYEVGLLPEFPYHQEPLEDTENVGLGVAELTYDGSGAEVPIPVITEDEAIPPPPVASTSTAPHGKSRSNVPTISVTKPPAPRPVDLPTQQDINPSSPNESSSDYDLEAGRGPGRPDLQEEIALVSSKRRSAREPLSPLLRESSDSSVIPLSPPPPLDTSAPSISKVIDLSTNTTPTAPSPPPIIPDLMTESTPSITSIPLHPTTNPQTNGMPHSDASLSGGESSASGEGILDSSSTSIRLIGGGGSSGDASDEIPAEGPSELNGVDPSDSISFSDPTTDNKQKKHKKNKSSTSGPKKLGAAAGRTKDSSASLKSVEDTTTS